MSTVTIPLTQGKYALIDEEDYDLVSQYRWHAHSARGGERWYAHTTVSTKQKHPRQTTLTMHRLLLDAPKGLLVDHADGDGLNNTRGNIRLASESQNGANSKISDGFTSRYKGVQRHKLNGRWRATICVNRVRNHLGYFASEVDAARAYDEAARELFGEFARLNFPGE
jgi:hypothetical protein